MPIFFLNIIGIPKHVTMNPIIPDTKSNSKKMPIPGRTTESMAPISGVAPFAVGSTVLREKKDLMAISAESESVVVPKIITNLKYDVPNLLYLVKGSLILAVLFMMLSIKTKRNTLPIQHKEIIKNIKHKISMITHIVKAAFLGANKDLRLSFLKKFSIREKVLYLPVVSFFSSGCSESELSALGGVTESGLLIGHTLALEPLENGLAGKLKFPLTAN